MPLYVLSVALFLKIVQNQRVAVLQLTTQGPRV